MNYADYWTKHHPAAHHRNFRAEILTPPSAIKALRDSFKSKAEGSDTKMCPKNTSTE